jgi:outer membrane lipoprotein-sorting protein
MLSASTDVLDQIKKSSTISMSPGLWAEYNMNDLITGVTATNLGGETVTLKDASGVEYKPFLKLFPLASIISPKRPSSAGIKYFISNKTNNAGITYNALLPYNTLIKEPYRMYYAGSKNKYQYWVTPKSNGTSLSNCKLTVAYPSGKNAVANKIAIKFETSYGLRSLLSDDGTSKVWSDMTYVKPVTWTVKITKGANTTLVLTNGNVDSNGVVNLYWSGSSWSTTEWTTTPAEPVDIDSIVVEINSINVADTYLGVIEISARYVKDLTDSLLSFSTQKRASDSSNGLTPVGNVTANSLNARLFFEDRSGISFDKTFSFDKTKSYFYNNVLFKPYYNIIKSDNTIEKVKQGYFYADSWMVDEFGQVDLQALDQALLLQKIIAPDILIKDAPSPAIIKRLLDGIGFTNYNFNMSPDGKDSSAITPYYWYTDDTKTVWECIQDLCKDTQMVATFDEDNVLQFYTREWIYNKNKTKSFTFRYNPLKTGDTILEESNIISMSKEDLPSVQGVKILYRPQMSSSYNAGADLLWQSPVYSLGAGALVSNLPASSLAGSSLWINLITTMDGLDLRALNKTGYLVLNDEVIEYDAIRYSYTDLAGSPQSQWIESDIDLQKYQALGKVNSFKPTGEYRIKTRGAFGTPISSHSIDISSYKSDFEVRMLTEATKTTGTPAIDNSKISIEASDSSGKNVARSMLTVSQPGTVSLNKNYTVATTNAKFIDSTTKNFCVGTSFYFPLVKDSSGRLTGADQVIGGLALCLSDNGATGYYIEVKTEQTTATGKLTDKNITLWRFKKGAKPYQVAITDSQKGDTTTVTGISGGQLYNLDVKVNYDTTRRTFKINFDNTTIVATDNGATFVLPITEKVGLFSQKGSISYDYLYSNAISESQFASTIAYNPYSGMLGSQSYLSQSFGDFVLTKGSKVSAPTFFKEFGPVARELKYISAKYAQRPGQPRFAQITLNPFVTLLGSSTNSFGLEAYVLNNAGTFVPLADGQTRSFQVVGDQIIATDPFEYIDPEIAKLKDIEIVGFDSTWIQKEREAKELSTWMKDQWSRQQTAIDIQCFPNPLIQVGDLVEISYPLNSIYASDDTIPSGKSASKYVILDIGHSWDSGLSTSVKCRSIYTG